LPRFRHPLLLRFALFLALALVFQIETLVVRPRADSAAWLFMGGRQSAGQMPGRDLWDNKLPLIYLIGRAAMAAGRPQVCLWLVEAFGTAIAALAVAQITRRVAAMSGGATDRLPLSADSVGVVAGALLCILCGAPSYHAGGYMAEIYALPLSAVAVWLLTDSNRRRPAWAGAGVAWTLAVSFRPPLVAAAVLTTVAALVAKDNVRQIRALAGSLAGVAVGLIIVFAHPWSAGYLPDCMAAAVYWPLGFGGPHRPGPLTLSAGERLADFGQDVAKLGWLHAAFVWGVIASRGRVEKRRWRLIVVWYAAALASAAVGWASYAHYQYVAFAPLVIGCALWTRSAAAKASRVMAAALLAVTAVVVVTQNAMSLARYAGEPPNDADRRAVIEFVQDHARPDQSVWIWAWGRDADLFYRFNRAPGVRHFMAHSYFNMDLALFDEMVADFEARPPDWIVEDRRREKPSLTGPAPAEWLEAAPSLAALQSLVRRRYTHVESFGDFSVLRYVDSPDRD
jgi:hypothetical protein